MVEFTDAQDRKWQLRLDIAALRRIRARIGQSFMQFLAEELNSATLPSTTEEGKQGAEQAAAPSATSQSIAYSRLTDPEVLAEVIFAIVQPQAEQRGVSFEDFCGALYGEACTRALEAFTRELGFFVASLGVKVEMTGAGPT